MPEHQQLQQSKNPKPTFQNQVTHLSQTPVSNPFSIIQRAKINPKSLTHADIMQLQRTIGNRAVGVLLSGIGNTPTAQQAPIQREESAEENKGLLQGKMMDTVQRQGPEDEEELMQGKMIEPFQRQKNLEEEEPLQKKSENNTGMPDNLKAGVESLSGIDMSDVRVHYSSEKPAEVGALAYTQGTDIHVAPGQEKHLPHEAWHVVQQKQGRVRPTMRLKGMAVNDDIGLEHEADSIGASILQMKTLAEKSSNQNHSIATTYSQRKSNFKKVNVIQRWAEQEHNLFGNNAVVGLQISQVKDYGELTKIAGDYAKTPEEISRGLDKQFGAYIKSVNIATTNVNHFFPLASKEWSLHHSNALALASSFTYQEIGNEDQEPDISIIGKALKEEAFAAHFLQDSYASGHQYPRAIASITNSLGITKEGARSKTYHDALCKLKDGLPLKEGRFHGDNTADNNDIRVLSNETRNSLIEVLRTAGLTDRSADTPKPSEGPDVSAILNDEEAAPIWQKMIGDTTSTMDEQKRGNQEEEFQTDGGTPFTRGEIIDAYERMQTDPQLEEERTPLLKK